MKNNRILLVVAVLFVGALSVSVADAGQLDGTYRIRQGDESVTLTQTFPFGGRYEVYRLSCSGVFTFSEGTLQFDTWTGAITSVSVTPRKDFLGLALRGFGSGSRSGRTLVINGLTLDNRTGVLHFD